MDTAHDETVQADRARKPLRRDARQRRAQLIEAAELEFAARGVDASLEKIARDAGVSIGTLYRHFPSRVDLLLAAFEPRLEEFLARADDALSSDDPWDGLVRYLETLFGLQA
ncbi:MAG: helix-turn-helix domain-containing protein, partial [Solirubrobacteraceae bacterium]|nr:helix-turn-helix domain-containing protein [Solirubrobacteraceae bacterium]